LVKTFSFFVSNTKLKTKGARFEGEALALAFFDSNFDIYL